jgi:uncharacterized membrane protein
MTWLQRYRLRHYFRHSLWILPFLSMFVALALVRFLYGIEEAMGWRSGSDPDAARTVLDTLAASMFTFIVFVSSALLVAVQLASAQLTPRIIALVFQNPVTKFAMTLFVFTFTLTLAAQMNIRGTVPLLTTRLAAFCCLASLGMFLFLIDHIGKALRPSGALWAVAAMGRRVIADVFPRRLTDSQSLVRDAADAPQGEPTRTVMNSRDGVVLAFDRRGLVTLAGRAGCVIELVPQVGDFIAAGDPLFRVYGGQADPTEEALRHSVAVGQERTLEQDPTFPFRVIVDIASKGLSPAINDPTTAVLAVDQIHHLLRNVGNRGLEDGFVRDAAGHLRLIYRTPDWEDFVHLAVTEIRQFGGTSIQIARRLRAMLENLIQTVPAERAVLLRQELNILKRYAERFFMDPDDRALADVSDFQGVGGKKTTRPKRPGVPAEPGQPAPAPRRIDNDGAAS